MPPRGVKSAKRKRQYEHVKESELDRGVGEERAEEIAARTVNKQRAQAGETRGSSRRKTSGGKKKSRGGSKASSRKSSGSTGARSSASSRKSASTRGRKAASKKR